MKPVCVLELIWSDNWMKTIRGALKPADGEDDGEDEAESWREEFPDRTPHHLSEVMAQQLTIQVQITTCGSYELRLFTGVDPNTFSK